MAAVTMLLRLVSNTYNGVSHTARFGSFQNYSYENSTIGYHAQTSMGYQDQITALPDTDYYEPANIYFSDMFIQAGDSARLYVPFGSQNPTYETGIDITLLYKNTDTSVFSVYNKEFGIGMICRTSAERGLYLMFGPHASGVMADPNFGIWRFETLLSRLQTLYTNGGDAYTNTMIDPRYAIFLPYTSCGKEELRQIPTGYEDVEKWYCSACNISNTPIPITQPSTSSLERCAVAITMPGCTSFWNWYEMITSKPMLTCPKLTIAGGGSLYLGVQDPASYHEVMDQPNNLRDVKSLWMRDFQNGTNISALMPSAGSTVQLSNGSLLGWVVEQMSDSPTGVVIHAHLTWTRRVDNTNYRVACEYMTVANAGNISPVGDYVDNLQSAFANYWNQQDFANFVTHLYYTNMGKFRNAQIVASPAYSSYYLTDLYNGISAGMANADTDYPTAGDRQNAARKSLPYAPFHFGANALSNMNYMSHGSTFGQYFIVEVLTAGAVYGGILIGQNSSISSTVLTGYTAPDSAEEWQTFLGQGSVTPGGGGESGGGGGGSTEPSGGNGDFDDTSDEVDDIGDTGSSTGAGTNFNMYWTNDSLMLSNFHKWIHTRSAFENRSQYLKYVISLKQFFTPGGAAPLKGSSTIVTLGGEEVQETDIGGVVYTVMMDPVTKYVQTHSDKYSFRIGSYHIEEYYGTALDYAPYTSISIYLPFAGLKQLDPSIVMASTLTVDCAIDFTTGMIVYTIGVKSDNSELDSIVYTFSGDCSVSYPVTADDYSGKMSAIMSTILGTGATIAYAATGNIPLAASSASSAFGSGIEAARSVNVPLASGSLASNAGIMSPKSVYLIIERPIRTLSQDQLAEFGHLHGYPCGDRVLPLSSLTGYTKVSDVNLENVRGATKEEIDSIVSLLHSGVIL